MEYHYAYSTCNIGHKLFIDGQGSNAELSKVTTPALLLKVGSDSASAQRPIIF